MADAFPPIDRSRVPEELPALSPARAALRAHVLEHSVKIGRFTLKSGATSSWFLDTKQTACRPDGILAVAAAMAEVFADVLPGDSQHPDDAPRIDAIGGLTMGADPVAFGVAAVFAAQGRALRSFSVRKEAKLGGITGRIAGALMAGDTALVAEDTTTRGTSLIEAVEQVSAYGAHPRYMTVIVDRGGTCAAMAAERGIDYRPLLTAPEIGFEYGT